MAVNFKQAT